ncbi:MAG: hypothetical protein NVS2B5_18010 [Beijerinckiaceae bacterium]
MHLMAAGNPVDALPQQVRHARQRLIEAEGEDTAILPCRQAARDDARLPARTA